MSTVKLSKTFLFQTIQAVIAIQFSVSTQFKYKYSLIGKKKFLFRTIRFIQTCLIQLIQFSTSTDFVYIQLNVKTVLLNNSV